MLSLEHQAVRIRETLTEYGFAALAPRLLALAEPCLRLASARRDVGVGGTKIGGDPDLPRDVEWPSYDGRPMTFLAQFDLAEIASIGAIASAALPRGGLLSFFFDRTEWHMGPDVCRVLHTTTALERRPTPGTDRLEECALEAMVTLSLPDIGLEEGAFDDLVGVADLSDEERDELWEWRQNLDYELFGTDDAPRHQLMGFPVGAKYDVLFQRLRAADRNKLDGPAARSHSNLLSIRSDENAKLDWADGGCLWYLIEPSALRAGDFSRVDSVWEPG